MFFLLKAAFWLGLVFILLPPAGPLPQSGHRQQNVAGSSGTDATSLAAEAASRVMHYCRDNAATCAAGAAIATEASAAVQRQLTQAPAPVAAPALRNQDTLTPADLQVPFGGILPAAGSAPRTAPLPPRRPA